jgi:1-acyl-sn-glycerol-3-phosphate acyltransferase
LQNSQGFKTVESHLLDNAMVQPAEAGTPNLFAAVNFVYTITWTVCRFIYGTYFRWRVFHPERVPAEGPVILASNHASFVDPPLVGCGINRTVNYLARESLFRFPGIGWYLRKLSAVPVDRDGGGAAGLRAIMSRLEAGGAILLFPEGTRTSDGKLQPARSGIGLTVIKSEAPVVPVRVFGTFEAYGRHMKIPRPRRIAVKYGRVMNFEALREEAKTCSKPRLKQIYQQIADDLMAEIAKLELSDD